jgi:hypothetical protein
MSQHFLKTRAERGRLVQVIAGFDRPTGELFCTVVRLDTHQPYLEVLFSSLGERRVATMAEYAQRLRGFGIELPETMIESIERDRVERVGNRVVEWPSETVTP